MYWTELTADVPREAADAAAQVLFDHAATAVHELDAPAGRARLRAHLLWSLYVDGVVKKIRAALRGLSSSFPGKATLRTRRVLFEVPVGDGFVPSWCFDTPMPVVCPDPIGERVVVKDPSDAFEPVGGQVVVELHPSRAFGNGTHSTTRLCTRALERFLRPGDNVLDIGTGTGLLALVAGRLGAGRVVAFDIEDEAVRSARENTALNHLQGVVTTVHGDALPGTARRLAGRVDLVLGNLLPSVIEDLAPEVRRALRPGGLFVVSGLRVDAVKALDLSLLLHGFDVVDVTTEGEWCCLVYQRLEAAPEVV